MSCRCQDCGEDYDVDLSIADDDWERIKPVGKPQGAGLLCSRCILQKLRSAEMEKALEELLSRWWPEQHNYRIVWSQTKTGNIGWEFIDTNSGNKVQGILTRTGAVFVLLGHVVEGDGGSG